jgi:hypothetical protein
MKSPRSAHTLIPGRAARLVGDRDFHQDLRRVLAVLTEIAAHVPVVYPVHPRARARVSRLLDPCSWTAGDPAADHTYAYTPRRPELWDGRAGERIVGEIAEWFAERQ